MQFDTSRCDDSKPYPSVGVRAVNSLHMFYKIYRKEAERSSIWAAYAIFAATVVFAGIHFGHDLNMSSTLTAGGGLQCLAFALLSMQVQGTGIAGVSAQSLQLYLAMLVCRLACTLFKNAYVPADPTGDWLYQLSDVVTLLLVAQLLYRSRFNVSCDPYELPDEWQVAPAVLVFCLVLALLTHGDLADTWQLDALWMASVHIDTIAMLPQLVLLQKRGGIVESLTAHFVAAMFLSRVLAFKYWFFGFPELVPLSGSLNVCGYCTLAAHLTQLLLSADFMYLYVRSHFRRKVLELPLSSV